MSRRTIILILSAVLLAWTAAVFLPGRHFDFVNWDDYDEVVENPLLHPASTQHLREIWAAPYLRLYAPLSYTAWWLLSHVAGAADNPAAFHLLNIALHLGCAALVFSILLVCVKSPPAAFGGAVLFALHPLQVETVGWVAEMNNLLAALFSLAAIRLYLAFRTSDERTRFWYLGLASLTYVLALYSKPTAIAVPIIVLIIDLGIFRTAWRSSLTAIFPWFAAATIFGLVARAAQRSSAVTLAHRPLVAIDALAFYCGKLFWPVGLTIDYGRTPSRVLLENGWLRDIGVIGALVIILWLMWRDYRGVALGAMIMVAGLLPVLGLIPFGFQEYSTVADHFMYLAMLGPALAVATILAAMPGRFSALAPVAVLLVIFTIVGENQLKIWRNSGELANRALAIDPGSAIGNDIVGAQLDRAGNSGKAVPYFSAAVLRDPGSADFHYNLANALRRSGEFDRAIPEFKRAIALYSSPSWQAMNNLGVTYINAGRTDEAIEEFERVLAIDPQNAYARQNLQILRGRVPSQ